MDTVLQAGLSNALVAGAMAVLLVPLARLLRRPALTHALCVLILVKLVTPPMWRVRVAWPARASAPAQAPAAAPAYAEGESTPSPLVDGLTVPHITFVDGTDDWTEANVGRSPGEATPAPALFPTPASASAPPSSAALSPPTPSHAATDWRAVLAWVWVAGSALCLLSVAVRLRMLRRLLRFAEPAPPTVQQQARALAGRIGLAACPGVWLVPGRLCPMLFGLLPRPRLFVSAALWAQLDPAQRDTLLLHELAHFRRADHWVRPLEVLVTVLYWWHPAVWWTRGALREAEEQCCDAWVLWGAPRAAREYAAALLAVVDFSSSARPAAVPVLASGMGEFRTLKRRLTMMQPRNAIPRTLSRTGLAVLFGLAATVLPLAPTSAQSGPEPEPAPADSQPPVAEPAPANAESQPAPADSSATPPAALPPGTDPAAAPGALPPAAEPAPGMPPNPYGGRPPGGPFDNFVPPATAGPAPFAEVQAAEAEVKAAEAELALALARAQHAKAQLARASAGLKAAKARGGLSGRRRAANPGDGASRPTLAPDAARRLEALEAEVRKLREELVGARAGKAEPVLTIFRLEHASAAKAAEAVAGLAGVKVTIDERTNSILLHGDAADVERVEGALIALDVKSGTAADRERR